MNSYQVADFIVQIKNAYLANRKLVTVPYSNVTKAIGDALVKNRLLASIKEETLEEKRYLLAELRYVRRKPALTNVEIISKPSLRVYVGAKELLITNRGATRSIVSTSRGIMTGREAQKKQIGGELLFKVW